MNISEAGIDFIRVNEGCELLPYLDDAGVPTIGIGTIRYPDGKHVTMADGPITVDQAEEFLAYDIKGAVQAVDTYVWRLGLNQNQFDSLVDFAYNLGSGALHDSTLLRRIRENKSDPKIKAAFLVWNKVHKDGKLIVSKGLTIRRGNDANLYFKPVS